MVDTGSCMSFMSLELARTVGNPIAPHASHLTGAIANEMRTKSVIKAETKHGIRVAADEFSLVKDVYPEIMIGLSSMMENN